MMNEISCRPQEERSQEKVGSLEQWSATGHTTDGRPRATISQNANESAILSRQTDTPEVRMGFLRLYQFSTAVDKAILTVSAICAIAAGVALPVMTIILGNLVKEVQDFLVKDTKALDSFSYDRPVHNFRHQIALDALYFVAIGGGEFITVYISIIGFNYCGERIICKTRERFLEAILRQNMGFFDQLGAGEVTNLITNESFLVQTAISDKIAVILTSMGTFLAAIVVSLVFSWRLALISLSSVVLMFLLMGTVAHFSKSFSDKSRVAFDLAASLAEETIKAIKLISAYGAQSKLLAQFDVHLAEAEKWGIKAKVLLGVSIGGVIGILFLNLGLCFWEGSRLLIRSHISEREIVTITLSIVIGSFSAVFVAPNIQSISAGISAGAKIFGTIERASPIDPMSDHGIIPTMLVGNVSFNEVRHIYPSRRETVSLDNVSLHIPAGKTVAFVGPSGAGKTTFINLLQRFYEPLSGMITVDDHDITTLNLRWLRRQMSLVSQEPTLFSATVYQNIAHGFIGSQHENISAEKQRQLVTDAAKMANAHDFIMSLPNGYDTWVGEDGSQISGGQKQRVAIARAIVRDPKILLLDEATSSLDSKSEALIQEAINKAAQGRTTLIVSHRLSTIQSADHIVVVNHGRIIEQGTHQELFGLRGFYYALFQAQQVHWTIANHHFVSATSLSRLSEDPSTLIGSAELAETLESDFKSPTGSENTVQDVSHVKPSPSLWSLIALVFRFNRPDVRPLVVGLVFSIISGGGSPTHVVFLVKNISSLSRPPRMYHQLRSDVNFWAGMYLMLGILMLLTNSIHGYALGICSERLLRRARIATFETIARQDCGFFDRVENSTGSLISFLSVQTTKLTAMSGSTLGTILSVMTTLIAALTVSIALGWKLGLVCMSMMPILLGCGFLRFYLLTLLETSMRSSQERSAAYACEAVSGIRTVASLTRENDILSEYHCQLLAQTRKTTKSTLMITLLYALSQALFFFVAALAFWYGGKLVARQEYTLFQLLICFLEVMFSTQHAGAIFSYAPDIAQAKVAATNLTNLFEQQSERRGHGGQHLGKVRGGIEFHNVAFSYQSAPSKAVLKNLNLTIKPGQHVALVGPSGSGKSTILALLERFYEPTSGRISIDGTDILDVDLNEYRSLFSIVSQNPTILSMSVRDNICLGIIEGEIEEERIIQACKQANIWEFIQSLPDGLNSVLGNKGVLLSGGQKQRISIARALVRDPKVLLFDEATSALDSQSEATIQKALEVAASGRTTITVAHRLNTIQHSDHIFVLDEGNVVEHGTQDQLLLKRGLYAKLAHLQNFGDIE